MFVLEQTLAGAYHIAELRHQAERDALAREAAPRRHLALSRRRAR